jgi:aminoglycoside phosphotransferase
MAHEVSIDQCPFDMSLQGEIERVRFNVTNGLVDEADLESQHQGKSAEDLVFTHGDYCLPNILIDGNEIAGFVDWSRAGVADRYKDIALVIRSLRWNLDEHLEKDFLTRMESPIRTKQGSSTTYCLTSSGRPAFWAGGRAA